MIDRLIFNTGTTNHVNGQHNHNHSSGDYSVERLDFVSEFDNE